MQQLATHNLYPRLDVAHDLLQQYQLRQLLILLVMPKHLFRYVMVDSLYKLDHNFLQAHRSTTNDVVLPLQ